jgi:hypothetical protein
LPGARLIRSIETVEHEGLILKWYAGAGILHFNRQLVAVPPAFKRYHTPGRRIPDSVEIREGPSTIGPLCQPPVPGAIGVGVGSAARATVVNHDRAYDPLHPLVQLTPPVSNSCAALADRILIVTAAFAGAVVRM